MEKRHVSDGITTLTYSKFQGIPV